MKLELIEDIRDLRQRIMNMRMARTSRMYPEVTAQVRALSDEEIIERALDREYKHQKQVWANMQQDNE